MELVMSYLIRVIGIILVAIAGVIGTQIGKCYKKYCDTKIKQDVVKTCVRAVEQLCKDVKGQEKYERALANILDMLDNVGITITELEAKMLIESTCLEFSKKYKESADASDKN